MSHKKIQLEIHLRDATLGRASIEVMVFEVGELNGQKMMELRQTELINLDIHNTDARRTPAIGYSFTVVE